ncbi:MAG: LysR family transcriptional regulator [Saprospiraceae bacterium]|jgi:DNA-binding transcriptional LysR family regulator|nr:LysR family transcriptional regulator [Saprospiraceae bacterium]
MNGKGIEAFLAIAMGQSFIRAAEVLNLAQSSVSHRLKQLERELGVILVDRKKGVKSIELTAAGEALLPVALKWQDVQRQLLSAQSEVSVHKLILGAIDSVNAYLLPPLFEALRIHQPRIYVIARTHKPAELYQMVENRELDIAFVPHAQNSQNIRVEPFFREKLLVARKGSGNKRPKIIRASDLNPSDEVRIGWGTEYNLWHDQLWGLTAQEQLRVDSVSMVRALLHNERDWAIVPESASAFLSHEGFFFQKLSPSPPERIIYKLTHRYPKASALTALEILNALSNKLLKKQR